jgi:hypothetical protein
MRDRLFFLTIVLFIVIPACTKEFPIDRNTESFYVIEGRISNLKGPYYIRITRSFSDFKNIYGSVPNYVDPAPVKDALVIISDDKGVTDTLKPPVELDYSRYTYSWESVTRKMDSLLPLLNAFLTYDRGYYQTTKITGVPGHTYKLTVRVDNKEFHASAYMPFVPALDSVKIGEVEAVAGGDKGLMPLVYFNEPQQEKNYYMLQHNDVRDYIYDNPALGYISHTLPYVVDDDLLLPYVKGLPVRIIKTGHHPCCDFYFPYLFPGYPVQVKLGAITKETYEYFKVLTNQLHVDGNVYKPVPASPMGNISGGAQGFFYATHVSYKLVLHNP